MEVSGLFSGVLRRNQADKLYAKCFVNYMVLYKSKLLLIDVWLFPIVSAWSVSSGWINRRGQEGRKQHWARSRVIWSLSWCCSGLSDLTWPWQRHSASCISIASMVIWGGLKQRWYRDCHLLKTKKKPKKKTKKKHYGSFYFEYSW